MNNGLVNIVDTDTTLSLPDYFNTDIPNAYTGIGCAGKTLIVRAYTDSDDYESFAVDGDKANPLYFSYLDNRFTYTGGSVTALDY